MPNIIDRTKNKIPTLDKAGLAEMRTAISMAKLTPALREDLYRLCDDREEKLRKIDGAMVMTSETAISEPCVSFSLAGKRGGKQ